MGTKIRFILDNYVDLSILSASPSLVASLGEYNLKLPQRSKVARTTSNASQLITTQFAAPRTVSAIVLGRHNFVSGMTLRFKLYDSTPTLLHDSGNLTISGSAGTGTPEWTWGCLIPGCTTEFKWGTVPWGGETSETNFEPSLNYVYWIDENNPVDILPIDNVIKVEITILGGTSLAYYEVGRLIVGNFIEPTYNFSYGHGLTWDESTRQFRTESGSLRSDASLPYRRFEFDIGTISEADRETLQDGFRDVGMRKDFFMSAFPCDTAAAKLEDFSFIGKLTKIPTFTEFVHNYYKSKYTIEEV